MFQQAINAFKLEATDGCMRVLCYLDEAGITATAYHYNPAIAACRKEDWRSALWLLMQMECKGVDLDTIAYNAAISACEMGGKWERALELQTEMERKGIVADTITCNALISACGKGGKWERVLELAREMERKGIVADTITYSALIPACEDAGQLHMRRKGVERSSITYEAGDLRVGVRERRTTGDVRPAVCPAHISVTGGLIILAVKTSIAMDLHEIPACIFHPPGVGQNPWFRTHYISLKSEESFSSECWDAAMGAMERVIDASQQK